MVDLDLAYMSAGEQARLIATGELSPVELIDNALARIEQVQPIVNAFCFVWAQEARAAAIAAADAVAHSRSNDGAPLGILHGVPIALKDTTPTAGHRTTLGSYAFEHWVPETDGSIVTALRNAGAIVVGKTTTPEFAHSLCTESPLWGITRNPWDPDRTTGGSSGGSGAAVATGCVSLAEGSDMGGSVRIPAAWCGVVGLKPGLGRIPMDVLPGLFDSISHHGPLARCVDDARLFLAATQGPDSADILSVTAKLELDQPLGADVRGMRIGVSIDLDGWYVEPGVRAAVQLAADALSDAGAELTEVHPRCTGDEEHHWNRLWGVFMAAYYGHLVPEFGDRMDANVLRLIEAGQAMGAVDYKQLEFVRTELWGRLRPILDDNHAMLCSTMATGPIPASFADWNTGAQPASADDGLYHSPDITAIFNLVSPCPALTVPCGRDADGLPVGTQLIGRRWQSDTVLRIGAAIEAGVPPIGRPSL